MANLYTYPLTAWIRFFSQFVDGSVERMQRITDELQDETYTPSKLLSDVTKFWLDGTLGWWTAWQQSYGGPVPIVFIKMRPGDDSTPPKRVPVDAPRTGTVEKTKLVKLSDASPPEQGKAYTPPSEDKLDVEWEDNKPRCFLVRLRRIDVPPPPPDPKAPKLTPGLYQSLLHMDEKLLAVVQVLITD